MALHDIYAGRGTAIDGAAMPGRDGHEARRLPSPLVGAAPGSPGSRRYGIVSILWRRKGTVLVAVVACAAVGVAYLAVTPPRYTATAAMLIDPRLGKSVGSDPNAPGFVADAAAMDSQIKLFTSQAVLSRVAAQAGLAKDPEFNGKERSLLQRLLHPGLVLDGGADLRALEDAIAIKRPERTYVVEIDVAARDAAVAAAVANDLTQAYIDDQVSSRRSAAREDTGYVAGKLATLTREIKTLDDRIEDYKAKNRIIEVTGLRSNEQQVADLTRSLGDARARASDAKAKFDEVAALAKAGRLDGTSEALKSLTIERLRQAQAETEQNTARLAETLGSRHPEMREAAERQAKIRALITAELGRLRVAAQGDWKAAQANEAQIRVALDTLKVQAGQLGRSLVPLDQLERDRGVLRASFDRFAQLNGSLAQQEAGSPPGRVIAVARPPVSPSSPKRTVVGLAALSSGVFLGVAAALLLEGSTPPPGPMPAPDEPLPALPRRRYWSDDEF